MKHLKLALSICLFLFSAKSLAMGFYLEPGLFYEKGDNKLDWPSPLGSSTGTTKGMGVDLKLGMHFTDMIFVAVDGTYSKPKFENSAPYDADATSTTYAGIIGVQTPLVGLRFWAGYVFGGTLDPEETNGYDVKFEEAKGYKVGAGIKIFFVAVNLEYMDLKYDKSTVEKSQIGRAHV